MNKNMTQNKVGSVNASVQSIESFLNLNVSAQSLTPVAQNVAQNISQLAYHEMAEVPLREVDTLEQLERNVHTLAELRSRLQFMNREIRYLMKI